MGQGVNGPPPRFSMDSALEHDEFCLGGARLSSTAQMADLAWELWEEAVGFVTIGLLCSTQGEELKKKTTLCLWKLNWHPPCTMLLSIVNNLPSTCTPQQQSSEFRGEENLSN